MTDLMKKLDQATVAIDELSLAAMNRKQSSIRKLWPDFDNKVSGVRGAGAFHHGLASARPEKDGILWNFECASVSTPGRKYPFDVFFEDTTGWIKRAEELGAVTGDGKHIDTVQLARRIMKEGDVRIYHECPAWHWWGFHYMFTQDDAIYDPQGQHAENIPPDVRNPRRRGYMCKHGQVLLQIVPAYYTTLAKHIKSFYKDEIADAEVLLRGEQDDEAPVERGEKQLPNKQEEGQ